MASSSRARRTDPETSHQAAERLTPDKLTAAQARVHAMFKLYGDMPDAQLVKYLHEMERSAGFTKVMSPSGVRSRRSELAKPNMDRLDELMVRWAEEHRPRALGKWTVALMRDELEAQEYHAASHWARTALRSEGFRSPLWDTGSRVKVDGSNVIVWGIAR